MLPTSGNGLVPRGRGTAARRPRPSAKDLIDLAVWILVHLMCIKGAVAAAGLCLAWRRHDPRSLKALFAAALVPLLQTAALGALWPLREELSTPSRVMLTALALLSWIYWAGFLRIERLNRYAILGGRGLKAHVPWLLAGLFFQVAALAVSAWVLAWCFVADHPFHPVPPDFLSILLAMGGLSGAMLLGSLFYGWLPLPDAPFSDKQVANDPHGPIHTVVAAVHWLQAAILLRLMAIALTVSIGIFFNPFGWRFFLLRLFADSFWMLFLRVLLGIVMPVVFIWAGVAAAERENNPHLAASQFLPALIVAFLGEFLAAGLTVGLAGLAL